MLTAISMSAIATNGVVPGNTWSPDIPLCSLNVSYHKFMPHLFFTYSINTSEETSL